MALGRHTYISSISRNSVAVLVNRSQSKVALKSNKQVYTWADCIANLLASGGFGGGDEWAETEGQELCSGNADRASQLGMTHATPLESAIPLPM